MKINELIEALRPLTGWRIYAVSDNISGDTFSCYTVRRLERHERESRANVVLVSAKEPVFDRTPGLTFLAGDTIRADWTGDRVWLETKGRHLGYIQRIEPIEEN